MKTEIEKWMKFVRMLLFNIDVNKLCKKAGNNGSLARSGATLAEADTDCFIQFYLYFKFSSPPKNLVPSFWNA